ncbi:MAG: BglG family transcription antiterminator LicT [Lachnospiraceae bacterium]
MKILKVINNNVVSAYNDNGKEIVVMGKGVGFQKKSGDEIEESKIEKTYHLGHENTSIYEDIIKDIPYEYVKVASQIISHAKKCLNRELSKNIYITLTDHMNYAITRTKQNVVVQNALLWEIKRYYYQEYQLGKDAVEMIQEKLGVQLSEDEAGFFALHIVNAEIGADMTQTAKVPDILKDIVNIVSYTMGIEMDENSLYYERFITHLKFFLERILKKEPFTEGGYELNDMVKVSYPESYRCAMRIQTYIRARLQYEVVEEELTYLTIHIQNLVRQKK